MNPAGGNGYEKHNGSPQRYSPQRHSPGFSPQERQTYVAPRVPYHPKSYTSSITNTYRKASTSPLQETQNIKSNEQTISMTNAREGASRGNSANRYTTQISSRDKENSHSQ